MRSVFFILSAASLLAVSCRQQDGESGPQITVTPPPKVAPELLRMTLLEGEGQVSFSDYRGKILLVNFFGSGSEECRAEIGELNALAHDLRDRPFVLLGVTFDLKPQIYVKDDLRYTRPVFPCAIGGKSARQTFPSVRHLPTKWLFDREGHVVKRYEASVSFTQIRADIGDLLK